MAPKQKQGPLDGSTVVLSGTFPGHSHGQSAMLGFGSVEYAD
jgi:hypothetical protein